MTAILFYCLDCPAIWCWIFYVEGKKSIIGAVSEEEMCVKLGNSKGQKRTSRREMSVVPAAKCRCLVELDVTAVWQNEKYVS